GGIGSVPRDAPVFRNVNGAGDQPLARRDHGRGHAVDVVRANLAGGVAASLTLVGALRLPLILKRNVRRARRALAVRPLHVQDRHGALELTLQNFRRTRAATGRPVDSHALRDRQRRNFGRNGIPVGVVRVKRIPHFVDRLAERRHEQVFLHCHGRGRSVHSGRGRGRCRLPNGRGGRGGRGVVPTNAPLPIHRNHTLARRARRGGLPVVVVRHAHAVVIPQHVRAGRRGRAVAVTRARLTLDLLLLNEHSARLSFRCGILHDRGGVRPVLRSGVAARHGSPRRFNVVPTAGRLTPLPATRTRAVTKELFLQPLAVDGPAARRFDLPARRERVTQHLRRDENRVTRAILVSEHAAKSVRRNRNESLAHCLPLPRVTPLRDCQSGTFAYFSVTYRTSEPKAFPRTNATVSA